MIELRSVQKTWKSNRDVEQNQKSNSLRDDDILEESELPESLSQFYQHALAILIRNTCPDYRGDERSVEIRQNLWLLKVENIEELKWNLKQIENGHSNG